MIAEMGELIERENRINEAFIHFILSFCSHDMSYISFCHSTR